MAGNKEFKQEHQFFFSEIIIFFWQTNGECISSMHKILWVWGRLGIVDCIELQIQKVGGHYFQQLPHNFPEAIRKALTYE
jgi:hypothetical protein